MKVSIITATFNSKLTLPDTIESVFKQTYSDIEYLIIDGESSDGTVDVIKHYEDIFQGKLRWISEKDNGIYDAMNKGIKMSTGDIVGILNSDDYFTSDTVVESFVKEFSDKTIDAVYGDIHFIRNGIPDKIIRYYSSAMFQPFLLRFGFMPAHPSFYVRREVYHRVGLYKTDYKIGADFEMMVRIFKKFNTNARYIAMDFVTMRIGGASTKNMGSRYTLLIEDARACRENGIYTNPFFIGLKYIFKLFELRF
uniref:Glycosyltransferase family 2 protein n=4 Tax=unclassified Prevotella TaxID=2638335 RepID=A0AB33IZ27_9BACT